MASIDYRQLRRQLSMRRVLELLAYPPLRIQGPQWRGRCPLPRCPNSHRFCFSVNLSKKAYRCFACGSQGNPLDLWSAVHQLPLYQAALDLCRHLAIDVPFHPPHPQLENRHPANHSCRNKW